MTIEETGPALRLIIRQIREIGEQSRNEKNGEEKQDSYREVLQEILDTVEEELRK